MTQQKIGRYFGQVKYSQSDVQLPKDEDYTVIIDVMLKTMRKQLQDEEIDLSLPASYEELNNMNIANTPKIIDDKKKVYADIMRTLASKTPPEAETRNDWYRRLKTIVCDVTRQQCVPSYVQYHESNVMNMLQSLTKLCDIEREEKARGSNQSHAVWSNFWQSMFTCLNSSYITGADGKVTVGNFVRKGACEEVMVMLPPSQNEGDASKPIDITVKPDFLLCTNVVEMKSRLRIAIVGEITTTNFDGATSPQSHSENSTSLPPVKKQKISYPDIVTMSPPLTVPSAGDDVMNDEAKKLDILEKMRTQHFTELLCMMRISLRSPTYEACSDHMFGWYSVMNKVYFTCLVAKTAEKSFCGPFISQKLSEDYIAQNKEPSPNLFKQFCFPPLNVFIPDHFEALFEFVNYLVWGRKPE